MSFRKVSKENFGAGSISLYLSANNESSMMNYLSKDREIEGKVLLNIMIPTFLKGIWVKILGSITINYPDNSKLNQYNINTFDLFKESDEYYLDGLHEVLLGFGEEDNNYGSLVDIKPGRYQYPFLFKLPFNAPASYFDTNVNISYKIIVILDSPSDSNRIAMENEIIIPSCSKLYCLKLREDITIKRDVMKVGRQLHKQNNQSLYFFPTILNIIRTPVQFNVTLKSMTEDSQRISNNSNNILSLNSSQYLNFENKKLLLEFECSIQNLRLRNIIVVKCDLYSEICIKSSPKENFPVIYPLSNNNRNYDKHDFIHKISESSQTISCENFDNFCVQFPIEISVEPYLTSLKSNSNAPTRLLLSQLFKHPGNKGKILHYTIENPLFRIRILLKMSLLKQNNFSDKSQEFASTFGEIYISPPFADNMITSTSNKFKNDIRSIPRASMNDTERTIPLNYNTSNNTTDYQSLPHQDNIRQEVLSSRIPLQDRSLFAARPTSGIRNSQNVGGVARFRSQHINNLDTENIYNHINILPTTDNIIINTNKTPHARPSKSKRVITVQAESLSRGPAAAVIDRQDQSMPNNSITPQRFAMMYEMCSASVLDGSPIVCASTPVSLSTVDFNRIREQNNNQLIYSFGSTLNINTPISNQSITQENCQDTQYDVVDLLLYNNNQSSDITYLNSIPNTSRSSTSIDQNTLQELSIIL